MIVNFLDDKWPIDYNTGYEIVIWEINIATNFFFQVTVAAVLAPQESLHCLADIRWKAIQPWSSRISAIYNAPYGGNLKRIVIDFGHRALWDIYYASLCFSVRIPLSSTFAFHLLGTDKHKVRAFRAVDWRNCWCMWYTLHCFVLFRFQIQRHRLPSSIPMGHAFNRIF